jgi:predicted cupin superfamily sugar epimerase
MIDSLLKAYDWFEHPDGPYFFVETHRDKYRTSGHWLFLPGSFSSFHKVNNNDELWLIHMGQILLHILDPDGNHSSLLLGADINSGELPVVNVPAGYWQAAELPDKAPFAFGSNVCAPAFSFDEFSIADRDSLLADYPNNKELILRLTRISE